MPEEKDKLLIVDDEELNRSLLKNYLEKDYEIIEAADGYEAMEKIQECGLALSMILLDIIMPRLDGFGVLKFLNEYGYISEIPVILITADKRSGREEMAFDLGVSDFILKPFNPAVVVKRVRNIDDLFKRTKELRRIVEEQNMMIYEQTEEILSRSEE